MIFINRANVNKDIEMTNRMFPSSTTSELKSRLSTVGLDAETMAKIVKEIGARESGISVVKVTPQIEGGKVQHRF